MAELPDWVGQSLRCPVTGAPLEESRQGLTTRGTTPQRSYPIRGGIPVLLADAATLGD